MLRMDVSFIFYFILHDVTFLGKTLAGRHDGVWRAPKLAKKVFYVLIYIQQLAILSFSPTEKTWKVNSRLISAASQRREVEGDFLFFGNLVGPSEQ